MLLSEKSKYKNNFNNGILAHYFLDFYDYHIKEINKIEDNFVSDGSIYWNEKE